MLDPAVSAAIKKFGLMKWACMEYPYLVFSFATGIFGAALGIWAACDAVKKNERQRYFLQYVVMRPDDPRLKKTIIWGEDGKPIN